jgi:hypothetical protein
MSHRNVIQDKSLSRIVYMVKFCLLAMPYMFLSVMLGGVEWSQIILVELAVISTVLVVGSFSTYQSVIRQNYISSLTSCYLYLFIYFIISGAISGILRYVYGDLGSVGDMLNPAFLLNHVSKGYGSEDPADLIGRASLFFIGSIGFYFLFLQAACSRLALLREKDLLGPAEDPVFQAKDEPLKWKNLKKRHVKLPPIRLVPGHTCESFIGRGIRNLLGFIRAYPKITCVCIILSVVIIRKLGLQFFTSRGLYIALYVIVGIILFFLTAVRSATAFSAERQSDRLDLLLSTPVTGMRFVFQAFVSITKPLLPLWIGLLLAMIVGNWASQHDPYWHGKKIAVMAGMVYCAAYLLFVIVMGMMLSSRCRNNARAVGLMMAIIVGHWVGPLMFSAISDGENHAFLSPLTWFALMTDASDFREEGGILGVKYLVQVVLHLSLANIFFGYLLLGFDRIMRRQPSGPVRGNLKPDKLPELP